MALPPKVVAKIRSVWGQIWNWGKNPGNYTCHQIRCL